MFIDRNKCLRFGILPIFLSYAGLILSTFYSELSRSEVESFPPGLQKASVEHAISLRDQALEKSDAFALVESLTTEIGPRLAGTEAEARAREWAVRYLSGMGFDSVVMEPFPIKAWIRGRESAVLTKPSEQGLAVTALGGSVSTPETGLEAELVVFQSLSDLESVADDSLLGKIVYVGHAMRPTQDGSSYGAFVPLRRLGPSIAAAKGAIGIVIRSIGTDSHRNPNTGQLTYVKGVRKIPAGALSNPDSDQIERLWKKKIPMRMRLVLMSHTREAAESGNVVAEIQGRESPWELVVIGAHLDSWDLGTGAIDDGAGVGITMAAAKLILDAGKRPRRTIRLVLWGAEEQGIHGGKAYLERHRSELRNHMLASESDFGAGLIWQITSNVSNEGQPVIDLIGTLLNPLGIVQGGKDIMVSGPDLYPMINEGLPSFSFRQDGTHYFDFHHTANDTLDKIDPKALDQNAAAYAVFAWLVAETTANFWSMNEPN